MRECVYKNPVPVCQILRLREDDSDRWKWRYRSPDGKVTESAQTYAYYYECITAARMSGYQPDMKWLAGN